MHPALCSRFCIFVWDISLKTVKKILLEKNFISFKIAKKYNLGLAALAKFDFKLNITSSPTTSIKVTLVWRETYEIECNLKDFLPTRVILIPLILNSGC
jgi:hypothetical protein